MPLQLPVLDDRNFEQILQEAKRRIPSHTPEWTNFNVESDPGITIVQLFAFLTDNLLYRANRIPERNRLKFLQLLGIPLQQAAAAQGIVTIRNERGPIEAKTLPKGVVVTAGKVSFLSRDGVTVLPVAGQIYYKREIPETDARYKNLVKKYNAVLVAKAAAQKAKSPTTVKPAFYETAAMPKPTASAPKPVLDLAKDTYDAALYIALLAPKNAILEDVREAIANKTLSIGIVPALEDTPPPLPPVQHTAKPATTSDLIFEIADASASTSSARYARLPIVRHSDVLREAGIVQVKLPAASKLQTWSFSEPMEEGSGDYPPRIEDQKVSERIVTWIRIRLPRGSTQQGHEGTLSARLSWVGFHAARITQAVTIANEALGTGTGEPDQTLTLANTPIITGSIKMEIQDEDNKWQLWRLTDDLLAEGPDERVYTIDPESGQIFFGSGLRGLRPPAGKRIRASYEYGGGRQGNVSIGVIKSSPDIRLQGGFKVENPVPTWGGDEGESVAEGTRNIPRYLRHHDRLVTELDFRDITQCTPGVDVGRVEILSLFRPHATKPEISAAGTVTVMVVPKHDPLHPRWPSPDRLFLQTVCDHLAPRRLITTEIHVRGPEYKPIHVSVGVRIREGYFRDEVLEAVQMCLEEYLSALPPGGPDQEGWPLNRELVKKDLEAVVTRVAGVEFVKSMKMSTGVASDMDEVKLVNLQLPLLAGLSVREGDAEPLSAILNLGKEIEETTTSTEKVVSMPVTKKKCC